MCKGVSSILQIQTLENTEFLRKKGVFIVVVLLHCRILKTFFSPKSFSPAIIVFRFSQQVKYTFLQGFKFQNSNNAFKLSTH